MRNFVILAGFLVGLLFSATQNAGGQAARPARQGCENAQTQLEMNRCSAEAYQAADKDLNALYVSIRGKLDGDSLAKLQAAQRAWISYRDANCEAESALYEGGSIQPAIRSGCLERATRARIAELHTIYDTGNR